MTLTKMGCKMWIQKWHQTSIVFWKWLWAMAKTIQHLCMSRFFWDIPDNIWWFRNLRQWAVGDLTPSFSQDSMEISWDDMHVSSLICFIAFHSWLFTILPYCSFCFAMILPHCSSCFHDFTICSMFFLLFPTCSMAFFEKNHATLSAFLSASTVVACSKRRQSGQRRAGPLWRHSARQGLQNLGSEKPRWT